MTYWSSLSGCYRRVPYQWKSSTRIARTIATLPPIRLAGPWLTNEQARSEQPFALLLEHGLVNGVIDHIVRRPDGLWQIVDYKIGPIPDKAKAAERHLLQLKIYGLFLAKLFQDQGTYPTVPISQTSTISILITLPLPSKL